MEVVFLIGVIQSIFLAALVIVKKNKMLADKILAVWLLFMGLHLFSYYMEVIGLNNKYPETVIFTACFPMLQGAFTFIYVVVITSQRQKFNPLYLLHTIFYVVFTIAFVIIATTHDSLSVGDLIIEVVSGRMNDPILTAGGFFNIFLGPIYMGLSLYKLRKHSQRICCDFSYTEKIDLKWLWYVVWIMAAVWVVVVLMNLLGGFIHVIPRRLSNNIIFTSLTIAIFFYGFFGIKQQIIYSQQTREIDENSTDDEDFSEQRESSNNRYKKSGLKKEESEEYLRQLLAYMENDKPYLDGKLSLKQVAEKLDISTNYLSQVINENLQKNFFDFVNEYRVDLVKEKIGDTSNKNYTLLAIAYDCGFNSKSSFNSIFKRFTGSTPSQYMLTV
jgi:AraC-like DNA-binding protein